MARVLTLKSALLWFSLFYVKTLRVFDQIIKKNVLMVSGNVSLT